MRIPRSSEDLERTEIARLPVLLARELVSQQNGSFLPPTETALHSDFYPALEYVAQQAFLSGKPRSNGGSATRIFRRVRPPSWADTWKDILSPG